MTAVQGIQSRKLAKRSAPWRQDPVLNSTPPHLRVDHFDFYHDWQRHATKILRTYE